jgi:hypothetical protein
MAGRVQPNERRDQRLRPPAAVLAVLALLLVAGPTGLAMSHPNHAPAKAPTRPLDAIARDAGCRLVEYDSDPRTNPPVSGRVDERISARDGSYVGRRAPSRLAGVHALLHGRVVVQYRPDLPAAQVASLDRLVRRTPARTLLFANDSGMRAPVAATSYLTLMTCPRVDAKTLGALRAFRARRVGFGQGF